MKCPYCDGEHANDARFCAETGKPLIPTAKQQKNQWWIYALIIGLVLVCGVVGVGGLYLWNEMQVEYDDVVVHHDEDEENEAPRATGISEPTVGINRIYTQAAETVEAKLTEWVSENDETLDVTPTPNRFYTAVAETLTALVEEAQSEITPASEIPIIVVLPTNTTLPLPHQAKINAKGSPGVTFFTEPSIDADTVDDYTILLNGTYVELHEIVENGDGKWGYISLLSDESVEGWVLLSLLSVED